jgi:hypothetical protein
MRVGVRAPRICATAPPAKAAKGTAPAIACDGWCRVPARKLGMSELKERELGVRLLDRTTHSVALTDAGEAVLPYARETLASVDRRGT